VIWTALQISSSRYLNSNKGRSCKIWGFYGGDYESCLLMGYKNLFHTSQETHYVSATKPNQLMLWKIWSFHGGDYEEWRLLRNKNQFVPHRKHINSPLQSPAGYYCVRFEVFKVVIIKNVIFWDVTLCGSCENRRFGGTYLVHHHGDKNQRARNNFSNK
jgi:hypothetical protein